MEAGERPGPAHRLALPLAVVGGHGDDGAPDLLAEPGLRDALHLAEHERLHLLEREGERAELDAAQPVVHRDHRVGEVGDHRLHDARVERPTDEPLRTVHGPGRVEEQLPLGGLSHHHAVALVERDHRGHRGPALPGGDDLRTPVADHGGARVRRAEVDPDHGAGAAGRLGRPPGQVDRDGGLPRRGHRDLRWVSLRWSHETIFVAPERGGNSALPRRGHRPRRGRPRTG